MYSDILSINNVDRITILKINTIKCNETQQNERYNEINYSSYALQAMNFRFLSFNEE